MPKTQMKKVAEVTGEHFLLILTRYSVEVSAFYHPSSLLQIPLRSQKKSLEILAYISTQISTHLPKASTSQRLWIFYLLRKVKGVESAAGSAHLHYMSATAGR